MANFDPKKPLLGQQHFDQAPALHADPYPQLSAHPRSGQKYGATGQTPTSSHAGLPHASGTGKNNLECGIQPDRAPESSSHSTGRHAVTMADGCVLPVDPPNADRRDPPGSFEISKEHGIPLPDGSVLPVPSSKQRSGEERSRLQPPSSRLQDRGGGGSLYPRLPRLPEIQVPTPPVQYAQLAQHQPYQHNYGYPYQPYPLPQPAQPFHTVIIQPQQDPYQQQYHYQQQQLQHQQQQQQQLQQQQQWQQQQPERALELRAQTTLKWDPEHLSNNQCFVACIVLTLTLCGLNIFGLPCVVVATVFACKSAKAKSRGEFKEAVKQQTRSKCLNITAAICTYLWVTVVLPLIAVAVVLVVLLVVNQPVNS